MKELILYLIIFLIAYLFYVVFVLCRKNVLKKFPEGKEISYLKYKYGIKITDKNLKKIANSVCLANSFILSTTVYVISLVDSILLEILLGLVTLVILILVVYHIIGTHFKRKEDKHV